MAREQAQYRYHPSKLRRLNEDRARNLDERKPLDAQGRTPLLALVHGSSCNCHICTRPFEAVGLAA